MSLKHKSLFRLIQRSVHFKKEYDFLRITNGNSEFDYHYFWLRHNCKCLEGCNHPKTKERIINTTDIDMEVKPKDITAENDVIHIQWNDGHYSKYPLDFLMKYAYGKERGQVAPPHCNVKNVELDYQKFHDKKDFMNELGKILQKYGLVVVRNRGLDTEDIINDFGGDVVETCFGRIEDLMVNNTTNKNNDQLGYTNSPVDLHTDLPYIDNPPNYQLLQCIKPAAQGGDNYFVHSVDLAKYLKLVDRKAYDILTTKEVSFHRQLTKYTSIYNTPIIKVGSNGEPIQVRSSYFTYAPFTFDYNEMDGFYRAYSKFTKMSLTYKYEALLNSGDFVLYNNHKMLHARSGFTGDRHLRGIYFDRNQIAKVLGI